ncbi:hypothetical protein SAMN05444004_11053 [Jannaschia faecimaris]|uniref:Uncharacterized protein n=1 Tax=Jannaschia faecimaris TaxID=1244108 RepID=A0A1H3S1B8_9RHOB|nr:hypothetical protein [Jannaschia faecimaris]SDZ31345.1 hypothetical protein SAMN05444004_11053 [Jannaschia faecimaris]
MADQAELDKRIARLEVALSANADALEQALKQSAASSEVPDQSADLKAAQDELLTAQQTIQTLEQLVKDREDKLDTALERAKTAEAKVREVRALKDGAAPQVAALEAEMVELKAARAQDLAEMKALLAELEPMLENADA